MRSAKEKWLEARRNGIGASEIAAIVGIHPRLKPIDIWRAKVEEPKDDGGDDFFKWFGHRMEPVLADIARREGWKVRRNAAQEIFHADDIAFATPDGWAARDGGEGLWEAKTTAGHSWQKELPPWVRAQVIWGCGVLQLPFALVTAVVRGLPFVEVVEASPDEYEALKSVAKFFWENFVASQTPPPPDGSESYLDYLRSVRREAGFVSLTPEKDEEALSLVRAYKDTTAKIKALEEEKALLTSQIVSLLGNYDQAVLSDGTKIAYASRKGNIDWKTAALEAGVTEKEAERYRRDGSRFLRISGGRKEGEE